MPRVVLDASVLIAAAIAPRGVCGQLLGRVLEQRLVLVASPNLVREVGDVLARPKFRRWLTQAEGHQLVAKIMQLAELHADVPNPPSVTRDPKDDYVIALARAANVDFLISGDQHLTELTASHPAILTPRALLDELA